MSSDFNPKVPQAMDLAALRAKLAQENGKRLWQSLEELSETKEYREFLENEFPHDPAKDEQGMNRRDVLKLAAASARYSGESADNTSSRCFSLSAPNTGEEVTG